MKKSKNSVKRVIECRGEAYVEYIIFQNELSYPVEKKYRVINQNKAEEILATTKDFSNCYFDDVDLSDKDISEANFENSYLVGCCLPKDLRNLNFSNADFSGEYYNYEELCNVMVGEAGGLHGSDFRGANLSYANFTALNLNNSNFEGAKIRAANFRATDLTECNFEGISSRSASFSHAKATKANFKDVVMNSVSLDFMDCEGANFENAKIDGADMVEIKLKCANLKNATLTDNDMGRAKMCNTILEGSYLSEVNLSNSIIKNTNLSGVKLEKVRVWYAEIDSSVEFAELVNTDLSDAIID